MTLTTNLVAAVLAASFLTASLMTLLHLPPLAMPLLLLGFAGALWQTAGLEPPADPAATRRDRSLSRLEWLALGVALVIGLLRVVPYTYQYVSTGLVGAVTWDDNWHFQEVASLVNTARFPPKLNVQPDTHFHFYYLAWMPAAAASVVARWVTGHSMIKATYGISVLLIDLAAVWCLLMFVRHTVVATARSWALAGLVIAGAAADAPYMLINLLANHIPAHAEWWQTAFGIDTQFSALTTSLVWVPHHLIAGMAMLLAVVVATEPGTLEPRSAPSRFGMAGLLLGFAAFSSIFAFAGGVVALAPLLVALCGRQHRGKLAVLVAAATVPSLPLAYLYLHANSAGGFLLGQPYLAWSGPSGAVVAGIAGLLIAAAFMVLEVGWLFLAARSLDRWAGERNLLRASASAAFVFLCSTVVVSFAGSNNWAMRGAIVPAAIVACYWACVLNRTDVPWLAEAPLPAQRGGRPLVVLMASIALPLAGLVHLNELAVLARKSFASPAFASETAACKSAIREINDHGKDDLGKDQGGSAAELMANAGCRDKLSAYHIERRFVKPELSAEDRELTGQGP